MLLFSLKNTCKKVYLKMRRVLNKIQERAQNINVKLSELSHCECPQMQHSNQKCRKVTSTLVNPLVLALNYDFFPLTWCKALS